MSESSNTESRRVLIIANLLKASPRIPRLIRHLPSLGWIPTVITPRIPAGAEKLFNAPPRDLKHFGVEIIEAGDCRSYEQLKEEGLAPPARRPIKNLLGRLDSGGGRNIAGLLNKYYWRFFLTANFPDIDKAWKKDALDAAKKIISEKKIDIIISSSSPIISHIVASELKKEFGIPWVAEYRDLWSLNHNYPLGPIMHRIDKRLEKRTMRTCDAMVTVTDSLAGDLSRMFPEKKILSIPNGFDPNERLAAVPLTKEFTITYTGQIYHGKQDTVMFIDAISELLSEGKLQRDKARLRFYGPIDRELKQYSERKGISDILIQPGVIPHEESLMRQSESQALLFFNWDDPSQPGIGSLKLVEYLQAKRPIIATGRNIDNLTTEIIRGTNAGKIGASVAEIKEILLDYYNQYRHAGMISFAGKPAEIDKYDFRHSVRKYVQLMNSIAKD